MNTVEKIKILGDAGKYDICASSSCNRKSNGGIGATAPAGICKSFTPDGRCVTLFKVLYTNSCTHDCAYCSNSTECSNKRVVKFEPDELAGTFMKLYLENYAEGFFLSSGIIHDADTTMTEMIDVVRLLRIKYLFRGYVHLKILPGTSQHLVKQASELADRMSLNLEVPSASRMKDISSVKDYKIDILRRHSYMKRYEVSSGTTTQFVVGGAEESDLEILQMTDWMYKRMSLKRAYFNAFIPVPKTPLEKKSREPLDREHRLYQVDFLMRKYGIKFREVKNNVFESGMLPREDPKLVLARKIISEPIKINNACKDDLLRVPGIGPISCNRIIRYRQNKNISKYSQLKALGVVVKRAHPFIDLDGVVQKILGDYI